MVSVAHCRRRQASIPRTPDRPHHAPALQGFRQHADTAAARGGCLLCGLAEGHACRRRARRAASGVCRTHLEQAVLLFGPATLAERRSRAAQTTELTLARPQ